MSLAVGALSEPSWALLESSTGRPRKKDELRDPPPQGSLRGSFARMDFGRCTWPEVPGGATEDIGNHVPGDASGNMKIMLPERLPGTRESADPRLPGVKRRVRHLAVHRTSDIGHRTCSCRRRGRRRLAPWHRASVRQMNKQHIREHAALQHAIYYKKEEGSGAVLPTYAASSMSHLSERAFEIQSGPA